MGASGAAGGLAKWTSPLLGHASLTRGEVVRTLAGVMELRFLDRYAEIARTQNRLPHCEQPGATYFLTYRLADAIPRERLDAWGEQREAWLRFHPEPWTPEQEREYHERFSGAIERWLDAGEGACVLRRPDCARIVGDALAHFDGDRCWQHAWVVMPNHVHVLFSVPPGGAFQSLVQSWKNFTAREINALLGLRGTLWQKDYFDRLVRDEAHFGKCARYIRRNPEKGRLSAGEYLLWESAWVKEMLDAAGLRSNGVGCRRVF